MREKFTGAAVLLAGLAIAPATSANDTEAETALGGLTLKRSEHIRMDSEDLYVSRDRVRVSYRFTNTSDQPVETVVAFPLPDIPPEAEENKAYWTSPAELKFKTTVDGQPIAFEIVEQAFVKENDISARLRALKIPLNRFTQNFDSVLEKLSKVEKEKLVADGLLRAKAREATASMSSTGPCERPSRGGRVFRRMPSVSVVHEYVPLIGGSVGGGLSASQRDTEWFRTNSANTASTGNGYKASTRA